MLGLFEAISEIWRLPPVTLFGILLLSSDSSYCQQATAKPLLDAPLSSLLSAFDASKLTGDARRTFDVLTLIVEDTDKATTEDKRNGYLQEFLIRSQDFVREHPDSLPLWTLRAVAALEVNQAEAGREACVRMIGLKAGDSDDPRIRRVLAMLDRRGWFKAIEIWPFLSIRKETSDSGDYLLVESLFDATDPPPLTQGTPSFERWIVVVLVISKRGFGSKQTSVAFRIHSASIFGKDPSCFPPNGSSRICFTRTMPR
jgi:hypothetical protein